jgi:hypothetical protein
MGRVSNDSASMADTTPRAEVAAGEPLYIIVGDVNGPRSATWRIWSGRHEPDLFIKPRSLTAQKVSLHKSSGNRWRLAFEEERAAQFVSPGADRVIKRWTRPQDFGPGWTRGFVIVVPWTDLRRMPPEKKPKKGKVVYVPGAEPGCAIHVEVVFAAAGPPSRLIVDDAILAGNIRLPGGDEVALIARHVRIEPQAWRQLAENRQRIIATYRQRHMATHRSAVDEHVDLSAASALRVVGWSADTDDGTGQAFDLAALPAPPGEQVICCSLPPAAEGGEVIGPGLVRGPRNKAGKQH